MAARLSILAGGEYLAIAQDGFLATMPAQLTFEEAAPSTEGSHYALALIRKAKIRRGQDALVNGATGAIGSAAVQLLKQLGARVTAVCGPEHLELVMLRQQVRLYLLQLQDHTPAIPTAWTRAAVVMRRCLKRTVVRQLFRLLERQAPTRVTARRHVG